MDALLVLLLVSRNQHDKLLINSNLEARGVEPLFSSRFVDRDLSTSTDALQQRRFRHLRIREKSVDELRCYQYVTIYGEPLEAYAPKIEVKILGCLLA
jgi:hypothetical protein